MFPVERYHGRILARLGLEARLCVGGKVVCGCADDMGGLVLLPGSAAVDPGAVPPWGTPLTPSAGRFRLRAAARHAAGHATCSEHTRVVAMSATNCDSFSDLVTLWHCSLTVRVTGDEDLVQVLLDLGQLIQCEPPPLLCCSWWLLWHRAFLPLRWGGRGKAWGRDGARRHSLWKFLRDYLETWKRATFAIIGNRNTCCMMDVSFSPADGAVAALGYLTSWQHEEILYPPFTHGRGCLAGNSFVLIIHNDDLPCCVFLHSLWVKFSRVTCERSLHTGCDAWKKAENTDS